MQPIVHSQFEPKTSTWQYIVACPDTKQAVIIDPVLDYDQATLSIDTATARSLLDKVNSLGYSIVRLLETHVHADHLSAAHFLQKTLVATGKPKPPICIGRRIRSVQENFARRYGIPDEELKDAFDKLWDDDEKFNIGNLTAQVLHLPGHTPDHIGYLIGDNIFSGDSIFNPDVGTARCDFPGGDANALWNSMQRLLSLPGQTKVYTGHDYPPDRDAMPCVTVAEQKQKNKHIKEGTSKDDYIKWRVERDGTLNEPKLIHPSLQVNSRGGRLPGRWHNKGVFFNLLVQVPEDLQQQSK